MAIKDIGLLCGNRKTFQLGSWHFEWKFEKLSWCMRQSKWGMAEFPSTLELSEQIWMYVQTPHPQCWHFCGKFWVALKQKMAFSAVVWQRGSGGKLWAHLQAFMLSLLVGGRSAFGTARLPVWGQLNTAWDRALKARPVRSEVLCVFVCVCVCACICVCVRVGASLCNALIKFDEPRMLRGPKIPV